LGPQPETSLSFSRFDPWQVGSLKAAVPELPVKYFAAQYDNFLDYWPSGRSTKQQFDSVALYEQAQATRQLYCWGANDP